MYSFSDSLLFRDLSLICQHVWVCRQFICASLERKSTASVRVHTGVILGASRLLLVPPALLPARHPPERMTVVGAWFEVARFLMLLQLVVDTDFKVQTRSRICEALGC
jgi:hypothetical protein